MDSSQLPIKLHDALLANQYEQLAKIDKAKLINDNLLGIVGCIPGIGAWVSSAISGGCSYSDAALFRKIVAFIYELKDTAQSERSKFIKEIEDTAEDVAGNVLCEMINRMDNINKAIVMANLTKARINGEISIEEFFRLAVVCERIPDTDFRFLKEFEEDTLIDGGVTEILYASGALIQRTIDEEENHYTLSESGRKLLRYGLSTDVNLDVKNATFIPSIGIEDMDRVISQKNDDQTMFEFDVSRGK